MKRLAPLADLEARIVAAVVERPGSSSNEIARAVQARRQTTLAALRLLAARGLLRMEGRPGRTRAYRVTRRGSSLVPNPNLGPGDLGLDMSRDTQGIPTVGSRGSRPGSGEGVRPRRSHPSA